MTASSLSAAEVMDAAVVVETAIPAFNIPYHPMMAPVARALRDTDTVGMIAVARLEWIKFEAQSLAAVRETYESVKNNRVTLLHLDHCPVIDEDMLDVDYLGVLRRAVDAGYDSVMVDGSRLALEENIAATRQVVDMAHVRGVPVEAELGAVMGHEAGPLPPYEELFASGRGFTDVEEAARFVRETGVDWLSVAVGNIHGAISAARHERKIAARLNIEHLASLRDATGIPLVLHGGTGIRREYIQDAIANGIAKINVATAIRQPYEAVKDDSAEAADKAVYEAVIDVITNDLAVVGNAASIRQALKP